MNFIALSIVLSTGMGVVMVLLVSVIVLTSICRVDSSRFAKSFVTVSSSFLFA